MVAQVLPWVCI